MARTLCKGNNVEAASAQNTHPSTQAQASFRRIPADQPSNVFLPYLDRYASLSGSLHASRRSNIALLATQHLGT